MIERREEKMKKLILTLALLFSIGIVQAEVTDICMSPLDKCQEVVIEELNKATSTIDLALYSLTLDSIADAIVLAHERGVDIRVIIDNVQFHLRSADARYLQERGITVYKQRGLKGALMHHKFAIIDSTTVLSGSYNWTANGSFKNSENLMIIRGDDFVLESFQKEFETLWKRGPYKKRSRKRR